MWLQGGSGGSAFDTCYIEVSSVEAVIVHDRQMFEKSKNTLLRGQPLSSLQLKRSITTLTEELSVVLGKSLQIEIAEDSFEDSSEVRGLLFRVLKLTTGQIGVLAKDEFGKQAVQEAVNRLIVRRHESQAMEIADRALHIDPTRLEGATQDSILSKLNSLF